MALRHSQRDQKILLKKFLLAYRFLPKSVRYQIPLDARCLRFSLKSSHEYHQKILRGADGYGYTVADFAHNQRPFFVHFLKD